MVRFRETGEGVPLLLIHGGIVEEAFAPLLPHLKQGYRLLMYTRRGYDGDLPSEPPSMEQFARDALAVLDAAGVERAHVVGYSMGGSIALELGSLAPERVLSLSLLEPGLLSVPSAAAFAEGAVLLQELYQTAGPTACVTANLEGMGMDLMELDEVLPEGWRQAAERAMPAVFALDNPALGDWDFDAARARDLVPPALLIGGTESIPLLTESFAALTEWMPGAKVVVLQGVDHGLQLWRAEEVADAIRSFLAEL